MFRSRVLPLLMVLAALAPAGHAAPPVINMSHYDLNAPDFPRMKREGILGVIHEATYPPNTGDEKYAGRQTAALENGLLWGAYHFANNSDPVRQADAFMDFVARRARGGVLLVLDFEKNEHYPGGTMALRQAAAFAERVHQRTGQYPGVYSNENRMRAAAREMESDPSSREILRRCWLWVANYHYKPTAFSPWSAWTLWQYTGDGIGDMPVSNFPKRCGNFTVSERNIFNGSDSGLKDFWNARAWRP